MSTARPPSASIQSGLRRCTYFECIRDTRLWFALIIPDSVFAIVMKTPPPTADTVVTLLAHARVYVGKLSPEETRAPPYYDRSQRMSPVMAAQ